MAFNFNWSPLIADTSRARDMLTTALNKSPKPPIIVDDIVVNELNLGTIPPELEILEIGDLAEDRFRGIFKMSYAGDAYLTLKTRVQANPLNTYLSTRPSFSSPEPLAASSGLTIPIQISLSDIRLSGFVILVFSRQKGITLVFRNDPLESLKVSSTFDSIPFVRNYLQKEIEQQLRVLFMDDLPAIIHRLSLRHFVPEYRRAEEEEEKKKQQEQESRPPIDPLSSPPQNPTNLWSDNLDDSSPFSLDSSTETHASFSQKNLLRLAALSESQRTLSLFTPSIRDTVFRAWAGAKDSADSPGMATPRPHPLSRIHSSIGNSTSSCASSVSDSSDASTQYSRPSISSISSNSTVYTMGSHRPRSHAARKRKHRVVDLRKSAAKDGVATHDRDTASETSSGPSITVTEPSTSPTREQPEIDMLTPVRTPRQKVRFQRQPGDDIPALDLRQSPSRTSSKLERPSSSSRPDQAGMQPQSSGQTVAPQRPKLVSAQTLPAREKTPGFMRSASSPHVPSFVEGSTGGILEQAWMMKMAQEIARKVREEKSAGGFWTPHDDVDQPPPAYGV